MLRASRRVLRPGGRTAFFTIHPTPGLPARLRRRAHRDGPVAVASHVPAPELLRRAGFVDVEATDCTAEFLTVAQHWVDRCAEHRDALVELQGAEDFEQRQAERAILLQAVRDGLLRRSFLVATRSDDP